MEEVASIHYRIASDFCWVCKGIGKPIKRDYRYKKVEPTNVVPGVSGPEEEGRNQRRVTIVRKYQQSWLPRQLCSVESNCLRSKRNTRQGVDIALVF